MSASDRAVKKERPKNHFGFAPVPAFAMNDFNDHGTQFPRGALRLGYHVGEPVDLSIEERRLHLYIAGKTGTGKTTLMANLAVQDLQAGRGFALLDPHGDMAERLLHYVPRRHTNSTVYLNPNDRSVAVGINVLEDVPPDYRPLVAAGVVAAMKHIWRDSWGARLAHFLLNTVLALEGLEEPVGVAVVESHPVVAHHQPRAIAKDLDQGGPHLGGELPCIGQDL
jgi:hypothetical protein